MTKPLKLSYNWEYCPYLFLDSFKSQINAKGYMNAMYYNLFQQTLTGEVLSWFYELPTNLVECFQQVADRLVHRFILRTDGHNTAQLFKVRQESGE